MLIHENAGWLFYKAYYREINFLADDKDKHNKEAFQKANLRLSRVTVSDGFKDPLEEYVSGIHAFEATTTYPGLLIGSGYQHETGREGELKLGFFFDHTLGLPVIPGSSVKGLLRSAFTDYDLIRYFAGNRELTKEQIDILESQTFDRGDIFLDAIIVGQEGEEGILAMDTLTPHAPDDSDFGQFKNPVPIGFLKVRAGVTFRFRFVVEETKDAVLSSKEKLALFENIILHQGAGAKTVVGFGQLTNENRYSGVENTTVSQTTTESRKGHQGPVIPDPPKDSPLPRYEQTDLKRAAKQGKYIVGEVTDNQNKTLTVRYWLGENEQEGTINYPASDSIPVGSHIRMKVKQAGNPARNQPPSFGFGGFER